MSKALLERCRRFCQTAITYSPGQSAEKDALIEALRLELLRTDPEPVAKVVSANWPHGGVQLIECATEIPVQTPLYLAPASHTEEDVQRILRGVADWDIEEQQFVALVREILEVPAPEFELERARVLKSINMKSP